MSLRIQQDLYRRRVEGFGDEVLYALPVLLAVAFSLPLIFRTLLWISYGLGRVSFFTASKVATAMFSLLPRPPPAYAPIIALDHSTESPSAPPLSLLSSSSPLDESTDHSPLEEEICPICHQEFEFPCTTNCSHTFCGDCLVKAWEYSSNPVTVLAPLRCPICRQLISDICHGSGEGRPPSVLRSVELYNRLFGSTPLSLWQRLKDIPLMARRALAQIRQWRMDSLMQFLHRVRFIICAFLLVVYLVSPYDLLSEGSFGLLGVVDDIIVVIFFGLHVFNFIRYNVLQAV